MGTAHHPIPPSFDDFTPRWVTNSSLHSQKLTNQVPRTAKLPLPGRTPHSNPNQGVSIRRPSRPWCDYKSHETQIPLLDSDTITRGRCMMEFVVSLQLEGYFIRESGEAVRTSIVDLLGCLPFNSQHFNVHGHRLTSTIHVGDNTQAVYDP